MKRLLPAYRKSKAADHPVQTCKVCKQKSPKSHMEPHHPRGRAGDNLLAYFWVHPSCHRWIHDNPAAAEERGLLNKGRNTNIQ